MANPIYACREFLQSEYTGGWMDNVNLDYSVPVVTTDGHIVMLSDQGVPTLLFFQARNQHEGHLHADVVAAVRLNSIEDLQTLQKAITDTIKKHKNREP